MICAELFFGDMTRIVFLWNLLALLSDNASQQNISFLHGLEVPSNKWLLWKNENARINGLTD